MALITLKGKEYEQKFTYKSLRALETHYGKGVFNVLSEEGMDKLETINVFLWACLKREKDFKNKNVDQVVDILDEAFEAEELTLELLTKALETAFTESTLLKGVQGQQAVEGAVEGDQKN
jgi:hypothetical protein